MKVLLVEDNKDITALYKNAFEKQECQVFTEENGLNAISVVSDISPDLILLDLMMPEMDGFEFLEALKNNTSMKPNIIIASNLSDQESIDKAMTYNVIGYLKKSDYTPQQIVENALLLYRKSLL